MTSHKRPWTDRGDRHEDRWRSGMLGALDTPETERTIYDQVLVKEAQALDSLLRMLPAELATYGLEETRELHDEVLDLYNRIHGKQLVA